MLAIKRIGIAAAVVLTIGSIGLAEEPEPLTPTPNQPVPGSPVHFGLSPTSPEGAAADSPYQQFEQAQTLERQGKRDEAFLAYAAIPGYQASAVRLGKTEPRHFLKLLQAHSEEIFRAFAKAIEADLHLALADRDAALACCRAVAACVATNSKQGWTTGHIPQDSYLAEARHDEAIGVGGEAQAVAFQRGPGSHRDNWLIRRLIALDSPELAHAEWKRVWQIHRNNAAPYVTEIDVYSPDGKRTSTLQLVQPTGFNASGLQFAIDYAFFLRKTNRNAEALDILREPLIAMDMDRNPNSPAFIHDKDVDLSQYPVRRLPSHRHGPWPVGIARKEFLRLAFGVFKADDQLAKLISDIQQQIDDGENRLRRVLARIRMLEGKQEDALRLELAYIASGNLNELSKTVRRGRIFEEFGENELAVAEYERALSLPYEPVTTPASDETIGFGAMAQMAAVMPQVWHPTGDRGQAALHADLAARLTRLYDAVGKPERAFENMLRGYDANPQATVDVNSLEALKRRAKILGKESIFTQWARKHLNQATTLEKRAALSWMLEDYDTCIDTVAQIVGDANGPGRHSYSTWRERFASLSTGRLKQLLTAILVIDPKNSRIRLELLDLQTDVSDAELGEILEMLLDSESEVAFIRGKGDYNRTKFRNYFDLAYRLMRIYQAQGKTEQLQQLGIRIATGEKPFDAWWEASWFTNHNNYDEQPRKDLNQCLALLVQVADPDVLKQLDDAWKPHGDFPAARQLARRLHGGIESAPAKPSVGWANVPEGIRPLASQRNVLSIAHDDRYLYAGHPWGVAVYDFDGKPVTRIALAEAARALAVAGDSLWAGTPRGLYRIRQMPSQQARKSQWQVGHLWLNGDVSEQNRYSRSFPGTSDYWFDNCVYSLTPDGEQLWIGTHRNVQRLDPKTNTLRAYSFRELRIDHWGGFERILVDDRFVWADGDQGVRLYDRRSDTWQAVQFGQRPVHLIAMVDDVLYGNVWLDDKLRNRPCVIDQQTLTVRPLAIRTPLNADQRLVNSEFIFYGHYQNKLAMGPGYPGFLLDRNTQSLEVFGTPGELSSEPIDSVLPANMRRGGLWWNLPVSKRGESDAGTSLSVRQTDGRMWNWLRLPDGRQFAGHRRSSTPRYEYPREDWPFQEHAWQQDERLGGLFQIDDEGNTASVSSDGDLLPSEAVFGIVDAPVRRWRWLCTDLGLTILDQQDRVLKTFTRADGLCGNRITSGIAGKDRLYFSGCWGDQEGGLIEFDPATGVFTGYVQSDGLATDKLARIQWKTINPAGGKGSSDLEGRRIELIYEVEYQRYGNSRYRLCPPGLFDPETSRVISTGEPRFLSQNDAVRQLAARNGGPQRPMPYLGGFIIAEQRIGDRRYLCGTRGVVVVPENATITADVEEIEVTLGTDPHLKWEQEAASIRYQVDSTESLERYLRHDNPYVRYRALQSASRRIQQYTEQYVRLLIASAKDSYEKNRQIIADLLGRSGDIGCVATLKKLVEDPDSDVRIAAALGLARFGQRPDIEHFRTMLRDRREWSEQLEVVESLAAHADREVFELLLEYPLTADDYEPRQKVFILLGQAVREHPEAIDVLLHAYSKDGDPGPVSNYGPARFAQEVLKHAGPAILPRLHKALASSDRVVRANAARACGAIADRRSTEPLLKALDLESGLSRAAIVWALGELKAVEALPHMVAMYLDARNDERHQRGTGYRYAQAAAEIHSQLDTIGRMEDIDSDWNELKRLAEPEPIDPRRDEFLLSTGVVLAAVRKIGPERSQDFYRKLAAEQDQQGRLEAARRMADASSVEQAKNLPILQGLLAGQDLEVRRAAAVSLLIMGRTDVRPQILTWLTSQLVNEAYAIVSELERVADGRLLQFARPAIEAWAGRTDLSSYQTQRFVALLQRIPR